MSRCLRGQWQPGGLDLLAAAVEQADVVEALVLELPVRPRGEPVLVVAVEDDERVVVDARVAEQLLELFARGEVAALGSLSCVVQLKPTGAGQVARVIGTGVDVDLDEADVRIVEVLAAQSTSTSACARRVVCAVMSL